MNAELRAIGSGIGVTIVCPAWVRTGILDSHRLAPTSGTRTPPPTDAQLAPLKESMRASGMTPEQVASATITAMLQRKLTVLPADMTALVEQRADRLARSEAVPLGGGDG